MLVLSRRPEEWIYLDTSDGRIRIQFTGYKFGQARLAFDAPQSVKIVRQELVERDEEESA